MTWSIEVREWVVAFERSSVVVVVVGVHRRLAKFWWRAGGWRKLLLLRSIVRHVRGVVMAWELLVAELRRWSAGSAGSIGGRSWVEDLMVVRESN